MYNCTSIQNTEEYIIYPQKPFACKAFIMTNMLNTHIYILYIYIHIYKWFANLCTSTIKSITHSSRFNQQLAINN